MGVAEGTPLTDASLPCLNITVSRLLTLYARADFVPAAVVELLETDPAIAGRILRLANSAYYGFESRVDTLQRAVVLLGSVTVQAVALGANLLAAWGGQKLPAAVGEVWIDAYLCAKSCRHLGLRLPRHTHRSPPDTLFLTGLLHPIGKIWFLSQSPLDYAATLGEQTTLAELRAREMELFGWDHAEAGGTLLEAWRLPIAIATTVQHQYCDQLRDERRPDWAVLTAAMATGRGETPAPDLEIPAALIDDLASLVERDRPEAEAFYSAIA